MIYSNRNHTIYKGSTTYIASLMKDRGGGRGLNIGRVVSWLEIRMWLRRWRVWVVISSWWWSWHPINLRVRHRFLSPSRSSEEVTPKTEQYGEQNKRQRDHHHHTHLFFSLLFNQVASWFQKRERDVHQVMRLGKIIYRHRGRWMWLWSGAWRFLILPEMQRRVL